MKRSLLARLEHQQDALNHLLFGLTEQQIRQRPAVDKWSIFENVAHLGRYQVVFLDRINVILNEAKPKFDRYVADKDVGFDNWLIKPYRQLLSDFQKDRDGILLFANQLADDQLQRIGQHPVYGSMTIEGWTEFFLLHEAHHFLTILKLAGPIRTSEQPIN